MALGGITDAISGGFTNSPSSGMGPDYSDSVASTGGSGAVGSVNIDGDAAATLQKPWWMGGAGWSNTSAAALGQDALATGAEAPAGADTEPEPAMAGTSWLGWGLLTLGVVGAGVAAWTFANAQNGGE